MRIINLGEIALPIFATTDQLHSSNTPKGFSLDPLFYANSGLQKFIGASLVLVKSQVDKGDICLIAGEKHLLEAIKKVYHVKSTNKNLKILVSSILSNRLAMNCMLSITFSSLKAVQEFFESQEK